MTASKQFFEELENYATAARRELHARWDSWKFDPAQSEVHEVVGALMARQVSMVTQLAMNPYIWNGHIAPIILRAMVDVYITFAWILGDALERSRKFILYGLGQEKLYLEHIKNHVESEGKDAEENLAVRSITAWIDSQRFTFLTEVHIGSWSGISTRDMAQEAGCMDIYRYAYTPFSFAAHSMWNHVAMYNLEPCENPLHRYHQVPVDANFPIEPDYLYQAAKYVDKTFKTFDKKFSVSVNMPSSFDLLIDMINKLYKSDNKDEVEETSDAGETSA